MIGPITVSVDVLGGDDAPDVVLEGTAQALAQDGGLQVLLCGPADIVEPFAASHDRCTAHPCTEEIGMSEHPAKAVRKKKDSSIVVGCRLVKDGAAQGFFSAGSTGACLAAGTLVIGRIKGIARPALCSILPSPVKPAVFCDCGANADCKPEYLVQFAQMGSLYAQAILHVAQPRVALLNIGEEDTKGSAFALRAHELLTRDVPGFVGNAEGRDLLTGEFDVIVTDGFTGNVTLKTIEGTSKVLFGALKDVFMESLATKLGALTVKGGLSALKDKVSPDTYGGAPLLGVSGACVVGHGSSSALAVKNGILATARLARMDVSALIEQTVSCRPDSATIE